MLVFAISFFKFCFSAIKLPIIYLYLRLCLKSLTLCDLQCSIPLAETLTLSWWSRYYSTSNNSQTVKIEL